MFLRENSLSPSPFSIMELRISMRISHRFSRVSLYSLPPNPSWMGYRFGLEFSQSRLKCDLKPPRVQLNVDMDSSSNLNRASPGHVWEDSQFVEVIGLGSRKDAVIDFCLASPSLSPGLRFCNVIEKETPEVQLQQRILGEDIDPRIAGTSLTSQSSLKAILLVAGTTYGSDVITPLDVLEKINHGDGLVVCIILKPFSFEGRRRQDEVKDLVAILQGRKFFCIMVDGDSLLENDLVTFDEALSTMNNAVLMTMNAISVLISELPTKFIDFPHERMKTVKLPELKKILGSLKEAKIGFGAVYNVKTSITPAVYDCPFLGSGVKDLDGIVVCILASAALIENTAVNAILSSFRQVTEWKGGILTSVVYDASLDPNTITTTVITLSCSKCEPSQRSGMFSKLAKSFPIIFNIFRKPHPASDNIQENRSAESTLVETNSKNCGGRLNAVPISGAVDGFDDEYSELQSTFTNNTGEINLSSIEENEACISTCSKDLRLQATSTLMNDPLVGHNECSEPQFMEEWLNDTSKPEATPMLHKPYKLPVGVKPSEDLKDRPYHSSPIYHSEKMNDRKMPPFSINMPLHASTDVMFDEAFSHLDDITYASLSGDYPNRSTKNGGLSARAASMLEAERDSLKSWSPVVEINYRGGKYIGRCQGGLPEGKGRLSLNDGSVYDGMWRYGKRWGLGTFFFSEGDVFRGSWRADVMHGKGWFYFHTGDRWFANLWKGKAYGEGRFYSKNGDIFFGHFKDGWRDGKFFCINADGSRFLEIWDEGVLVSRKQLESDDDSG